MNSHPACKAFRPNKRFHPRLESLEGRLCPSVTVSSAPSHNGSIEAKSTTDIVSIIDRGNGAAVVTDGAGPPIGSLGLGYGRSGFAGDVHARAIEHVVEELAGRQEAPGTASADNGFRSECFSSGA